MDLDDTTDTSDSQAVLAVEFNNQASLNQEDIVFRESFDNSVESRWPEDLLEGSVATESPIPLPYCPTTTLEEDIGSNDLGDLFSPLDTQAYSSGDVPVIDAEAGVCGLRNLGNTCFLSTGVQCLMATPALVHCLLRQPPASDSLTAHLAQLTHKMWSGQYTTVQPSDFKYTLGTLYPQFKDFRQHDCQEFLALLLDGLHEQMNTSTLRNKLQDTLETDCDAESNLKTSNNNFSNGLCKNISPGHNNYKEPQEILKCNLIGKNELINGLQKLDNQINNCVSLKDRTCKRSLNGNKCDSSDEDCVPVRPDRVLSVNVNRSSDNLPVSVLNNCSQLLNGFEDIIKDAKTSNVNVLVTEQEANNEIKFDSDKFPRSEKVRQQETFNFNTFHLFENNVTSGKRGKSKVTHYKSSVDFREGLDLKRLKMQRTEEAEDVDSGSAMECDWEKNYRMEDERKHRFNYKSLDKNYRMECERLRRDGPGPSSAASVPEAAKAKPDQEADVHWQKHLAAHQSVIVDTFQGQFKSTVVCSKCRHVSVTYEPFMYLSVPLPHAMERQLCVTLVSGKDECPVKYLVTVNKRDTVGALRDQLVSLMGRPSPGLVLAEVLDHHIAKILDENHQARFINSNNRSLYAFEIANFSHFAGEETSEDNKVGMCDDVLGDACTICLEEKDSDMSRHTGCLCILCESCFARTSQHYGDEDPKCPVCRKVLIQGVNLVPVGHNFYSKPAVRMLNVSLVCRLDTEGDGNNNTKTVRLFGHPRLLRLPNHLQGHQLHAAVASLVPYTQPYKLLLVDGQGHHCSRCMFNSHCRGCPVDATDPVVLKAGDCLAAMFAEPLPEITVVQHSSMSRATANNPLSLYDCIQAFSQSELLDEHNPWYCPSCQQNQCATKTLSVWRYPKYLIIYLKRFVFQDGVSTKLDDKVMFPLCGLNMSSSTSLYDLYACVCHVGGVSAGHYTAYTQHPRSAEWHHYNDECVTSREPQEEDFSNAYILFYKMRGADIINEDFSAKLVSLNSENLS